MLNSFSPTFRLAINGSATRDEASYNLNHATQAAFTLTQTDQIYTATLNLAAGATQDLDLRGGSIQSPLFETASFQVIRAILVEHLSTSLATHVTVGGTVTNQVPGLPGGVVRRGGEVGGCAPDATGWPVTAGTGDLYRLVNNDGSNVANVRITIIGKGV